MSSVDERTISIQMTQDFTLVSLSTNKAGADRVYIVDHHKALYTLCDGL